MGLAKRSCTLPVDVLCILILHPSALSLVLFSKKLGSCLKLPTHKNKATKNSYRHFEAFLCCHLGIFFLSCCYTFNVSSKLDWEIRNNCFLRKKAFHQCHGSRGRVFNFGALANLFDCSHNQHEWSVAGQSCKLGEQ